MKLSGNTRVHELLEEFPFLEDFLVMYHPKFEMLKSRVTRATIGRVATLRAAAGIAGVEPDDLLRAVSGKIERNTGNRPEIEFDSSVPRLTREERLVILKEIIRDVHQGGDLAEAKQRFAGAVRDVEATEIAAMEQQLIRDGLPASEVQRLCDVHVDAFREALDEHAEIQVQPGHPVHTYIAANKIITELANELGALARASEGGEQVGVSFEKADDIVGRLVGVENHYQRKENQLFPLLERHGVTGPTQVMWGVHDQIRGKLKGVRDTVQQGDAKEFCELAPGLVRDLVEMVYKEEKILFPMSLETLSDGEWAEIRRGEDDLGYVLVEPGAEWPSEEVAVSEPIPTQQDLLELKTGDLTLDQLNLILTHLPVDRSFVDESDTVRFYSEGPERIFPRSPAIIGRKVQNCHPPDSVHVVQEILDSFRSGKQSLAEFWIQLQGKFIHIRYFAVRDRSGDYRGCLEVSQDVTAIRTLEGERRLLAWEGHES
jgi:DUF438 domain-containing protein